MDEKTTRAARTLRQVGFQGVPYQELEFFVEEAIWAIIEQKTGIGKNDRVSIFAYPEARGTVTDFNWKQFRNGDLEKLYVEWDKDVFDFLPEDIESLRMWTPTCSFIKLKPGQKVQFEVPLTDGEGICHNLRNS